MKDMEERKLAEISYLFRAEETEEEPYIFRGKKVKNFWDAQIESIQYLIDDACLPGQNRELQKQSVSCIFRAAAAGVKAGLPFRLMRKYAEKKAMLVVKAKTIEEVKELMKPSASTISADGSAAVGKYHIPEEEFIMLLFIKKKYGLNESAQRRLEYLQKVCSESFSSDMNEEEAENDE